MRLQVLRVRKPLERHRVGEDEEAGEAAESSAAIAEEFLPPVGTSPRAGYPGRGAGGSPVMAAQTPPIRRQEQVAPGRDCNSPSFGTLKFESNFHFSI